MLLTLIINSCFELDAIPPTLKEGWITMVPKVKHDGSFSCEPESMRPITVLPELGKIANRILARRLDRILVRFPNLLSPAQRGFQMDGYVAQCTDAVLMSLRTGSTVRPGEIAGTSTL